MEQDTATGDGPDAPALPRTLLEELLGQRYWQSYRRFCQEYDRVATQLDKQLGLERRLAGTWPSLTQYKRWVRGNISRLPRWEPCAVLDAMFPDHRVEDLFKPAPNVTHNRPTDGPSQVTQDTDPDEVNRRQLLGGVAAVSVGAAIGPHLPDRPTAPAPELVDYFVGQLSGHYGADMYLGPHLLMPTIEAQFHLLLRLANTAPSDLRRKFLAVGSAYSALAGWLHQDAGDLAASEHWRAETLQLAHRTGVPDLVGYALVNKAMLAADLGDGVATVDLAEGVLVDERRIAPKVRVLAHNQAAHGYSLLGDYDACAQHLDHAANLVAGVDDDYVWGNACRRTTRYIDVQRATCYGRLGRTDEALALWDNTLTQMPGSARRDTGVYLARQASALASADQADQAVSVAADAMGCYRDTGSARLRGELEQLRDLSAPWAASRAGRELDDVLRPLAS